MIMSLYQHFPEQVPLRGYGLVPLVEVVADVVATVGLAPLPLLTARAIPTPIRAAPASMYMPLPS
jgi:hypothetical protein